MRKSVEGLRLINDKVDWNLLRTFLVIAQEQGINRAAAKLHITQPAVSQALKRLEEQTSQTLVIRGRQKFRLTEAGEVILSIAEEINSLIATNTFVPKSGNERVTGKIKLLIISRIDSQEFNAFLRDFHERFPNIDFEIDVMRSSDVVAAILQKSATAGITLVNVAPVKLESQLFTVHEYSFFCGPHHPFWGRNDVRIEDIAQEDYVSFTSDLPGGSLTPLATFRVANHFSGRLAASTSNLDELIRLIECSYGIGALPRHIVMNSKDNRLFELTPTVSINVEIHFVTNRHRAFDAAEQTFVTELRSRLELGSFPAPVL
jgi:DNA-binding transcriptional LysR family regulator